MDGERRFGSRRPFAPKPVEEGQEYDMEIEGIGSKGDGIGKIKGFVVIVPGVTKGEAVRVKINAVRGKVAFGEKVGAAKTKPVASEKKAKPDEDDEEMESEESAEEESEEDVEESEDEDSEDEGSGDDDSSGDGDADE